MTEPTPATASAAVPAFGRRHLAILGGLLAVAVFVGLTLGGVLSGDRGGGSLGASAGYVPADAVIYLEARLDLPGDQRAQLRALLDRFPAVNPDDVLTDALAHTLDEALSGGDAPFDYSNDVAPWFTGRIGLAMLDYPVDPAAMRLPSMLVLLGTRDAAAATALADALRTELESDGTSFRSSDHGGVTVWSLAVEADPMAAPMSGLGFAYAVSDDQLLLASGADVIATALDVHGGAASSLAGRDDVRSLVGTLPDEAAAFAVVSSQAMLDQMTAGLRASAPELADAMAAYLEGQPPISVESLGFESDAVVISGTSDVPTGALSVSNGRRDLARRVPADAIFFADAADVGPILSRSIAAMKGAITAGPGGERSLAELDGFEDALGSQLEDLVAWMGDGAFAAGWDGTQAWGGLVIRADDPDAARQRLAQLRGLVQLAQLAGSGEVTVTSEDVGDVEVTTIRVASSLMDAGMPVDSLVVEYALDDDTALVGFGDAFVRRALALDGGDGSLAGSARFDRALERVGGPDNTATLWLDLAALRDAAQAAAGDEIPAELSENLEPLDYLVSVSRIDGDRLRMRAALVLR